MNPTTNLLNSTASGGLLEAQNIANDSTGSIIIFILGFMILLATLGIVINKYKNI